MKREILKEGRARGYVGFPNVLKVSHFNMVKQTSMFPKSSISVISIFKIQFSFSIFFLLKLLLASVRYQKMVT